MLRIWTALALALLAGCDDTSGEDDDEVDDESRQTPVVITVTVDNRGYQDVTACLEDWDGHDRVDLAVWLRWAASADVQIMRRLKIHVYRDSDHALILDDFWDRSFLEASGGRLTVTVYP